MHLGVLPYINALPLQYGMSYDLEGYSPQTMIEKMREGELDVAMLPAVEILKNPKEYVVFPDIAICSDGPVLSMKIAIKKEPHELKNVGLFTRSAAANDMCRIILSENYGLSPNYSNHPNSRDFRFDESIDAQILIGNEALFYTERSLDIGEEWKRLTGKPAVYAVWAMRKKHDLKHIYRKLKMSKDKGTKNIDIVAAELKYTDTVFIESYLRNNIYYNLGSSEIAGLKAMFDYLKIYDKLDGDFEFPLLDI